METVLEAGKWNRRACVIRPRHGCGAKTRNVACIKKAWKAKESY